MHSSMINFLIIACVFTLTPNVVRTKCLHDNACLSPDPNCQHVLFRGIDSGPEGQNSKRMFLEINNRLRWEIAIPPKKGYKQASNMMELTWDQKLADLAQENANTCNLENDEVCTKCLMDDGISRIKYTRVCDDVEDECGSTDNNMRLTVVALFLEKFPIVSEKPTVNVTSISEMDYKNFGSFIKLITAKTNKIGCGYIAFKTIYQSRDYFHQILVCNYSPSAKISEEVYKEGPFCSNCPPDTCCGPCNQNKGRRGLCHVPTEDELNYEYTHPFNCNFNNKHDCYFNVIGTMRWKRVYSKEGGAFETTLNSGERSTVFFTRRIATNWDFRILIEYNTEYFGDSSDTKHTPTVMKLILRYDQNKRKSMTLPGHCPLNGRCKFHTDLIEAGNYKISLDFSVPDEASKQYFVIYEVRVLDKEI